MTFPCTIKRFDTYVAQSLKEMLISAQPLDHFTQNYIGWNNSLFYGESCDW